MNTLINILSKITNERTSRGWSEYVLAEKSDISQTTISSWYNKNTIPTLVSLEKICTAYDMTLSQFLSEGKEFYLTDEEEILIAKWSYLNRKQKEALIMLLNSFQ